MARGGGGPGGGATGRARTAAAHPHPATKFTRAVAARACCVGVVLPLVPLPLCPSFSFTPRRSLALPTRSAPSSGSLSFPPRPSPLAPTPCSGSSFKARPQCFLPRRPPCPWCRCSRGADQRAPPPSGRPQGSAAARRWRRFGAYRFVRTPRAAVSPRPPRRTAPHRTALWPVVPFFMYVPT
jgi:hypothetical protein